VTIIRPDGRRGLDGGICVRIADDKAVEQPVSTGQVEGHEAQWEVRS